MKTTFIRQYRKREANTAGNYPLVFVYTVEGTEAEQAEYKKSKGDKFVQDDKTKQVLYFTTRFAGNTCDLTKTNKGEFIHDTTHLDKIKNLTDQGYVLQHAKEIVEAN